jgi:protease-4
MKSFLKYTLATIVGLIIVHFVLFILLISIIGTISILGSPEVIVRNNSVLHIKLEDGIKDRTSNNPLDNIDLLNFDTQESLGLKNILSSIEYDHFLSD